MLFKNLKKHFFIHCWSFLVFIASISFWIVSKKIRKFVKERQISRYWLKDLQTKRSTFKRCVFFFCSSAGEYEQARPLIHKLAQDEDVFCSIAFFSRSGVEYAQTQGELAHYFLAPIDRISEWNKIFSILKPNAVIIIRHELWPSFLYCAQQFCKVWLIDACQSQSLQHSWIQRWVKKNLLSFVDFIRVVSVADQDFFIKDLGVAKEKVAVFGDTKYDRVVERALGKKAYVAGIDEKLKVLGSRPLRLIIGSAWHQDIEVCLSAYIAYRKGGYSPAAHLIIAPHQPTQMMLDWIIAKCRQHNLKFKLFSQEVADAVKYSPTDVIIIDCMGILCELYGACDLAFVGGAMHHQVHNVLEPASYGLSIAFGPKYQNSQEAIQLVLSHVSTVVESEDSVLQWLIKYASSPKKDELAIKELIHNSLNATQKILRELKQSA